MCPRKHSQNNVPSTFSRKEWQTLPELPTSAELMDSQPTALPQKIWDGPLLKEEYLENQYRLNRFEGTELLRRALNHFRENPQMADSGFYIYTHVHVQGYVFAKAGAACRVSFSTERSPTRVIWGQSSRLTPGTLVALSPSGDNFNSKCFVAVVAAKYLRGGLEPDTEAGEDENTPPRIEIFWADSNDAIIDPSIDLVMIEAKGGYYEQVRHTMIGLQHAVQDQSKFDKYIDGTHKRNKQAAFYKYTQVSVPDSVSAFDDSQRGAFDQMVSSELALVQGPPGTGKTFTSVIAIQSYVQTLRAGLKRPVPPIIVSAQTNHALDQLLEKCIETGANIVRIGGRSQVEAINERTIFNLMLKCHEKPGNSGEADRQIILQKLRAELEHCFPTELISAEYLCTEESSDLMSIWLADYVEQDRPYLYRPPQGQTEPGEDTGDQQRCSKDDERERLQGEFVPIQFHRTGAVPETMSRSSRWYHKASVYLEKYSDMYDIPPAQRGMVYRYLRQRLLDNITNEKLPAMLRRYQDACDKAKVNRWNRYVKIIQDEGVEVLGCTTTGLSKYRGLISALKPLVLMIEEAAETRESNITSSLYPSLDQIVLVGDHQQLVPHVDVPELEGQPYHFNKSLFERLVGHGLPYTMLKVQRRMIPIIRSVVHAFYPELKDHESVRDPRNRAPVPGMGGKHIWWFQHQWGECQNDNFSFYNVNESVMIVGFIRYLVQNGMCASQITTLTYYKGQVNTILRKLNADPILASYNPSKEWSVRTVDGFQGEENDVILLSLVRSPSNPHDLAKVGFVDNENRAVVATSRARCGMYIFGNSNSLLSCSKSNQTWQKVFDIFAKERCIGYKMPVVCQNHGHITHLYQPADWDKIPYGGCQQRCEEKCVEGHACKMTCHVGNLHMKCQEKCNKFLLCGHACKALCSDRCDCHYDCNKPAIASTQSLPLPYRPAEAISARNKGRLPIQPVVKQLGGARKRDYGKRRGVQGDGLTQGTILKHPLHNLDPSIPPGNSSVAQAPTPSQRLSEPTSEDLMELGYHVLVMKDRAGPPLPERTSLGFGSVNKVERGAIDEWSPQRVDEWESTWQLRRPRPNEGSSGSCLVGMRQESSSIKTPENWQPEVTYDIVSSIQKQLGAYGTQNKSNYESSRKQTLMDAAAGFFMRDEGETNKNLLELQALKKTKFEYQTALIDLD
ncbi:P-loop containing nucleoside triphosphate hydrolase protein [Mariannaea sp. PMI_226]|nr:P-loop containing nucleoside triphosphate hydrolase protein [Mariannaea sp. PMI_226]